MEFFNKTKEFFGLGPMDVEADEAYFAEDRRYESNGAAAYAPRSAYGTVAVVEEEQFVPRIVAISLTSFNDAARVGEPFREGDAVVFELTDAERGAAKRFVDFAAGLCFALEGRMINLTKVLKTDRKVFAIVPKDADFSNAELEHEAGLR